MISSLPHIASLLLKILAHIRYNNISFKLHLTSLKNGALNLRVMIKLALHMLAKHKTIFLKTEETLCSKVIQKQVYQVTNISLERYFFSPETYTVPSQIF